MAITISAAQYRDRFTVEPGIPAVVLGVSGSVAATAAAPTVAAATVTNATVTAVAATITATATAPWVIGATKPDATNTGVMPSVFTSTLVGDQTITVAGTVIDSTFITGRILVRAANVTITNTKVVSNGYGGTAGVNTALIDCNHVNAVNVTIDNCLLYQDPTLANVSHNGLIGHDYTATRCFVYDVIDGFGVYNNNAGKQAGPTNVVIAGNYVQKLAYFSPDPNHSDNRTHNDGVQIQGGTGTVIVGNNFNGIVSATAGTGGTGPATDPYVPNITGHVVTCTPVIAAISGVDCHSNWLYGGYGGIIVVSNNSTYPSNAGNFNNNRLHGAQQTSTPIQCDNNMTGTTFTGNVDDSSGSAIAAVLYTPGTI